MRTAAENCVVEVSAVALARTYGVTAGALTSNLHRLRLLGVVSQSRGRGNASMIALTRNDMAVLGAYFTMRTNWDMADDGPMMTVLKWCAMWGWPDAPMAVVNNTDVVPWSRDLLKAGRCVQVFGTVS